MHSSGHAGISGLMYAPILCGLLFVDIALAVIGLFIVGVLSSFPDFDVIFHFRTSTFHKLPIIGKRIPSMKHRGITHSIWFMIGIGLLLSVAGFFVYPVIEPVLMVEQFVFTGMLFIFGFIGILGHDLGDWVTPTGINIWYPYGDDPKALTFHSDNRYFVKFRTYSNQRSTGVREDGILTVAGSDRANYVANIIGLIALGAAIGAYILAIIEGVVIGIAAFTIIYLSLILFPIIVVQSGQIVEYIRG